MVWEAIISHYYGNIIIMISEQKLRLEQLEQI